jgi:hypothetical protein
MVSCGGAITSAVNGFPFELTNMAPREINVFPVPHSAIAVTLPKGWPRLEA